MSTNKLGYPCPDCDKPFSTSGNLKTHITTIHLNLRPYNCSYLNCSKTYSNQTRLNAHLLTHIGLKPYSCNLCHKAFTEFGNLKSHIQIHSQERPFRCPQCAKNYKTNGHLKDHISIRHNQTKKYECENCLRKFGRSSTLKSHQRIHRDEKPFKCPIEHCCRIFREKGNMKLHFKRHSSKLEKLNMQNQDCNLNQSMNGKSEEMNSAFMPSNPENKDVHKLDFHANENTMQNSLLIIQLLNFAQNPLLEDCCNYLWRNEEFEKSENNNAHEKKISENIT